MTSLLLATLPNLGCRSSAAGLSSRLGCHVLSRRAANTVPPWATHQQLRFVSGEADNYKDDHYATFGAKPSDSTEKIRKLGSAMRKATHSDHNKGIDTDKFMKVNAAVRVLGNAEKRAKFDPIWWGWQKAKQADAAARQRADDAQRAAAAAKDAARRREGAKRAMEAAEAAEAKKRDEERKARKLATRQARRAEAERQDKAAEEERKASVEENRRENERMAAINAAKAAEKKKAAAAAAELAATRRAALQARAAWPKREARMVVLRHVPVRADLWDATHALAPFRPGRILNFGVGEGTAWFEFFTVEAAQALQRTVTETDQCVILGKVIRTASIYQGRTKLPQGPELITRSLYIEAPSEFLDGEATLFNAVRRSLRKQGFTTTPVGFLEDTTLTGKWLVHHYSSVALAKSAKAVLERHYPELQVKYIRDPCENDQQTAQADEGRESESSKDTSTTVSGLVEFVIIFYFLVLAILHEIKEGKGSSNEAQQKDDK